MTLSRPEGITHPSIDELLEKTESKYSLVIYAAKRARQINAYFTPTEGMLQYVGPLVESHAQEKPLSIALREIHTGAVQVVKPGDRPIPAQVVEMDLDQGFEPQTDAFGLAEGEGFAPDPQD